MFVHYTLAYVVIGSLLLHIAVKLPTIRKAGLAADLDRLAIRRDRSSRPGSAGADSFCATGAGVAWSA